MIIIIFISLILALCAQLLANFIFHFFIRINVILFKLNFLVR